MKMVRDSKLIGVHFSTAELCRRAAAQKIGLFNAFG